MLSPDIILQNRYRIVRLLGKGGMGAIYEAVDQRVSCLVALKETLVGANNEAREAFQREAALLANLRHASLPKVMDYFGEGDGEFLVMEYIAGDDLAELLEKQSGPSSVLHVLEWANQILKLLDYLHTREPPILHRDIKPANLKVTAQGEVFLLDFGLAKGAAGQMTRAAAGRSVYGYTPVYAPLEQIHGSGTDPRSDLYALGATLYDLLTGQPPIPAPVRFEALENNQPDPLPLISQLNLQVSADESALVQWAMALSRRERPASAAEMRGVLRELLEKRRRAEDAKRAETTLTTQRPERPADESKPLYVDDKVQFTVYAPRKIKPKKTYSLLAFAHLSARRPDAEDDEPDPIAEVKAQAARLLGDQRVDYDDVKKPSAQPVPHGGELTFVPAVQGIEFSPPRRSFTWRKSVHREEFDMWVSEIIDQTLSGKLTVFLGSIVIAEVALVITVDRSASSAAERMSVDQPMSARRVRQVYASYSRMDEPVVAELAQVAPLFGTRFVTDRTHLEPGEDRTAGLQRLIRGADMFQLFWSSNSMRSADTVDEIRYAASLGRPGFILPTYWEEPLPRSPDENLPPPEIDRLQFHRIYPAAIAKATFANEAGPQLVILGPTGAEVYIDDKRYGSLGISGRVMLKWFPTGKHVVRITKPGEQDYEQVVDIQPEGQVIRAQFKPAPTIGAPSSFGASESLSASAPPEMPQEAGRVTAPLEMPRDNSPTQELPPLLETVPAPQPAVAAGAGSAPTFGTVICSTCGMSYPAAMKFCGRCGSTLMKAKVPEPIYHAPEAVLTSPTQSFPAPSAPGRMVQAPQLPRKRKFPMMPIYAGAALVLFAVMVVPALFMMSNRRNLTANSNTSSAPNLSPIGAGNRANSNQTLTNGSPKTFANSVGIEFVLVPTGGFMMGSTNGDADEKPVHQVTINYSFYMGKYEITQAQWQSVMGNNPSHFKDCGNCPVEKASWDDAQSFIGKLNQLNDGLTYRLPTEAEWEYACRAGTTGDYAGNLDDMTWYDKNSGNKTHAVGSKQPNAWGLADMHGNVWEWCEDWFHETYYGAPTEGSAWLSGGEQKYRVLRGGSWGYSDTRARSAYRNRYAPDNRLDNFGFRVVAVR